MSNVQNEMLALILKDLPNQTAGVLKSYLDEAAKNKQALETSASQLKFKDETIEARNKSISELTTKVAELQAKIRNQEDLDKQQLALEQQQRNMDVLLMQEKLNSLGQQNYNLLELSRIIFKNPTLVKTETHSVPIKMGNPGYEYVQQHAETKTQTETLIKE